MPGARRVNISSSAGANRQLSHVRGSRNVNRRVASTIRRWGFAPSPAHVAASSVLPFGGKKLLPSVFRGTVVHTSDAFQKTKHFEIRASARIKIQVKRIILMTLKMVIKGGNFDVRRVAKLQN